jgi:tRNA nucleotidyltransferase (CCA-adding enzyme)
MTANAERTTHVILTHENADFDAIASLLGAHKLYPNARPVLPHRVNRNVAAFLALYGEAFPFVAPDDLSRGRYIQRVILVDTQSLTFVRGMGQSVEEVIVIDHHPPPDALPVGWRFRGETLGATTTLLVETLSARLVPVSRVEATLMLAGIYEDTGHLTYATTTPRDLRAAAWLVSQGGNLEIVAEFLEHPLTPAQTDIYNALEDHAETRELDGHPVVLSWATSPPDTEEEISTLAHKLRDLLDPSALFILVQIGKNTQLVARSTTDDINVAEVAEHFGGGGHDRAAAALIRERPAQDAFEELSEILPRFVRPRVQVRDLMSYGVRTVTPETPVSEVAEQMLRTGHEGFPVVGEDGRVLGLVTRNAVDRSLQHGLGEKAVHTIMRQGDVTVSPVDSAERVRTLMIERGWGQIPVAVRRPDGRRRVIGVVTRTDMIRLPPSEQAIERQAIIHRMEHAFPEPLLTLIHEIGVRAAEMGHTIYFVGGIVRDLLLGQPLTDVDLVVEGDAIELGRALAKEYGGEIHTHSRFGTVKWRLPGDLWPEDQRPDLPPHIDLVTARTEFYEHPTALPMVEQSSIKQDLHRRDFTINTLAIRLDPQRWGELLDFYGGRADLEQGVVRVLHSLSFVDDPTRILRAARFEARLGFHLDPRSEALIADALPLLHRVTGERIRHELDLIFDEAKPEAVLDRLQDLGALTEIAPGLESDPWLHEHFARARQTEVLTLWDMDDAAGRRTLYWLLLLYRLPPGEIEHVIARLRLPGHLKEPLRALPRLDEVRERLATATRPSEVVDLLDPLDDELLALAWLLADDAEVRARLTRYAETWQHVHPTLTGEDLKRMGYQPGPIYRKILHALRVARLNGEVSTREQEEALVRSQFEPDRPAPG